MGRHTSAPVRRRPSPHPVAEPIPFAELRSRYDDAVPTAHRGRDRSRTRVGLMTAAATSAVLVTAAGVTLTTADSPVAAHPRANDDGQRSATTLGQGGGSARGATAEPKQAVVAAGPTTAALPKDEAKQRIVVPERWTDPVPGSEMTSCFCTRWGKFHDGIDLAAPLGTPIHAAGAGTVVKVGPMEGYGIAIFIRHSDGFVTFYGHMAKVYVRLGQKVTTGQIIAPVGNEGFSTGPHLHFSVYRGGVGGSATDPKPWLAARGVKV
jgi:murein DD-endopeptidase MepM/ murein hydrolase activator NlpD